MPTKLNITLRRVLLFPLTALYAGAIALRHFLYNKGIFKSEKGALPTLVLGNLHAGGTGKTPHASYFLQVLSKKLGSPSKVALLSRGFMRRTSGLVWVDADGDWRDVGDEPALLKSLNPLNPMAVCENRRQGVKAIAEKHPEVEVVVLDDGLQHRSLIPHKSVVILDSDRPLSDEALLPAGNLRDFKSRLKGFNAIIISRSSENLHQEMEKQGIPSNIQPVFSSQMKDATLPHSGKPRILAISGIAEPERFMDRLAKEYSVVRRETYSDHYEYTEKDVQGWLASIRNEKLDSIVTTSKDAVKIRPLIEKHPEIVLKSICIEVVWHNEGAVEAWVDEWLESPIFAKH
ncbi:MAG: tetraacyldisaccharide 4'-kinase [Crocinitomicaceae bacterium]|nr:tetraacyldisaccharide 4'-kinase [Crocinitomicaceae bacterium]|tara:strand:+ start:881 stop:1918 length:1038 start_codon:yes stop_codon:yes gene_type:complete